LKEFPHLDIRWRKEAEWGDPAGRRHPKKWEMRFTFPDINPGWLRTEKKG
jgi:hypothetical protein